MTLPSLAPWQRLLASLVATLLCLPAAAVSQGAPHQILVRFAPWTPEGDRTKLAGSLDGRRLQRFDFIRTELLEVQSETLEEALVLARSRPGVEYAEPNASVHIAVVPNDPQFQHLWALHNTGQNGGTPRVDIDAPSAWSIYQGDPALRVGVLDTGIDFNHPDLAANIWTNPGEVPGNDLDDDANGYVDDVHGYDVLHGDPDPSDDNGHGTHVAGTLAAVGDNGIGVTGVAWRCQLVAIKFLDAQGNGTIAGAIAGIEYALRIGVALTNNSWSGGPYSQALIDAIEAAGNANQLFVAAAGNSGSDNDALPVYPAAYPADCIVAVAATDATDALASFSNFGATSVDLAAPGVDILSCLPRGGYRVLSGTSMATPLVSGVATLLYGLHPGIQNLEVKQRLLASAVPIPALTGRCLTGARLDAFAALAEPDSLAPGTIVDLAVARAFSTSLLLQWTATGDDGASGRASSYDLRYATTPLDATNFETATPVAAPMPQPAGALESFEVTDLPLETTYWFAVRVRDEYGALGPLSNVATGATVGIPDIDLDPTSFALALGLPYAASRTLVVSNLGSGSLDITIPTPEILLAAAVAASKSRATVQLAKGEADPRPGEPAIAGHGGPDLFGYHWTDSDEPGGPDFEWIEIDAIGTPIPLVRDDQTVTGIPIGFPFPFYGNTFTTVNVASNGFLSFTSPRSFYLNQPLPIAGTSVPENLVAPLWDDLDFSVAGAQAFAWSDGNRFIVEYKNVPHYLEAATSTFEVVLDASGEIRFQYLHVGPPTNSATIGIQDWTRTVGLQVSFNSWYQHDGLAVRIIPLSQWLTASPAAVHHVAAGTSAAIDLHIDAAGLSTGSYAANLQVSSNDPDELVVVVPVVLWVTGVSDSRTEPDRPDTMSLQLAGGNPARGTVRLAISLAKREPVALNVFDVRGALVRRLVGTVLEPGVHPVVWDGRNEARQMVAAGVYILRLEGEHAVSARKVALAR